MCSPAHKVLHWMKLWTLKFKCTRTKQQHASSQTNFWWSQETNRKSSRLSTVSTVSTVPVYVPSGCGNHERSVLASFVIQSQRFVPRFILFSLFFWSTVESLSLFCFDVYKPAKPQTPVQVQSSRTVRGAAREPLLSFACSLSPPLSLYLSLPDRPRSPASPAPTPPPPPPPLQPRRRTDVYPVRPR